MPLYAVSLTVTTTHGNVIGRMTDPSSWEATVAARDAALDNLKSGDLGYIQLVNDQAVHLIPPAVAAASVLTFVLEEVAA